MARDNTQSERDCRRYWRRRKWLIEQLGGKCAECGMTKRLEIDHLQPRERKVEKVNSVTRAKRYIEEYRRGLVQLPCRKCNRAKGRPEPVSVVEAGLRSPQPPRRRA